MAKKPPPIPSRDDRIPKSKLYAPGPPSRAKRRPISQFETPPPLAKSYAVLPPLAQWQDATDHARFGGRANDPIMRAIDELVQDLATAVDGAYLYLMGRLFFTTMSWLNAFKTSQQVDYEDREPVLKLHLFAANQLAEKLKCPLIQLAAKLQALYGINMSEHGVDTDAEGSSGRAAYLTPAKREVYRLFIIGGRAYQFRTGQKMFMPLDTTAAGGNEGKGDLFAFSMSNKLFVGSKGYHSKYLAGRDVQCAGTIHIKHGVITGIKNDSGHYAPVDLALVKVLDFFRMNGLDLSKITVSQAVVVDGKMSAHCPETPGDVFMRNNGNWSAILKRAPHQPAPPI